MTRDDITRQFEFDQDPELYLLNGSYPAPASPIERTEGFYQSRAQMNPYEFIPLAIEADNQYIGSCELENFDNVNGICSLGIQIGDRAYWGRGYGREAVGLLLDYAFEQRGLRRVTLGVSAENGRAIHCYRACGFVEEGRHRQAKWLNGKFIDMVSMAILRDEWQALRANRTTTQKQSE
jgi:RimJ/RimL family protein N-acetyltransferase